MKSTRLATLCAALGLASFLNFSAQAQVTVDGTKEAAYGAPVSVQTITSSWGTNNTLASLSVKQEGSKLYVFVAGRADGNSLKLFIDSKTGGANKLVTGLVSGGGEEWRIHHFSLNGNSTTEGMTFETGFNADYALNIHSAGWSALFPLNPSSPQPRSYVGNINDANGIAGGPLVRGKRDTSIGVASVASHNKGWEFEFNITDLGVGTGEAEPVKFLAFIITDGVNGSPNQVLGPLPDSTDLGGWGEFQAKNFENISGVQAVTVTVNNADADGDGIPNATDPDDDNDGLTDVEEGTLGTNPLLADTDGDGRNDKAEVDAGTDPLKKNYNSMLIAGDFLTPTWSDTATSENTMSLVSGQQFQWQLNRRFTNAATIQYKFLGGSWSQNWGASATPGTAAFDTGNISSTVTASGIYTFSFNNDTLAYTFTRASAPATYAAWAAQYGLAAGSGAEDADSDSLSNEAEFAANSDPLNSDTDGDGLPDYFEVTGFNDFSIVTSPITPDTDGDGLRDAWELQYGLDPTDDGTKIDYVNNTGLAVATNPNGANADPDADGLTNLQEQTAGTNPLAAGTGFASAYPKITVPGSFNGFNAGGNAANTMQLVGNFSWKLIVYFAAAPTGNSEYKFAAGTWDTNWGPSATPGVAALAANSNIPASSALTAAGYYVFTFNDSTLNYSLAPLATADQDNDGLPDEWEAYYGGFLSPKLTDLDPGTAYVAGSSTTAAEAYAAGTDPVRDTTPPAISLAEGVAKLVLVPLNGTLPLITAADVVATDNIGTPTVTIGLYNVNGNDVTSIPVTAPAIAVVTYTATDGGGNTATVQRTVVVGDPAPPYYALNFPATGSISTLGSLPVYAQAYIPGATPGTGQAPNIQCWIGVNTENTDPSTWAEGAWSIASHNAEQNGNNDEYSANLSGATLGAGTFYYAARWQVGSGAFRYGGITSTGNGDAWGTRDVGEPPVATTYGNGVLTVSTAVARDVKFAVDMGVQIFKGTFDPAMHGVEVRGSFNSFAGGASPLVRVGTSSVYEGTFVVEGAESASIAYKFYATGTGGLEWEDTVPNGNVDGNRTATLTADGVAQDTGTAFFEGLEESRKLTLRVDMTTQIAKGNFNASSNSVYVAGDFNAFSTSANVLAPAPGVGSNAYSVTLFLDGPQSNNIGYKFFNSAAGAPNSGFEISRENANRIITVAQLGANLSEYTNSPVPLFSNDDGVGPTLSLNGSATVNLNVGDSFTDEGATATDILDGDCAVEVTGGPVSTAAAGTYTLTYRAFDVAGNASVPDLVTRTVVVSAASGSSFSGWLGSTPASAELVKQYAFGAATPGSAVNPSNLPVGGLSGSDLTLTYFVRGEATNANLVVPQVHTNLAEPNSWAAVDSSNITTLGTNTVDGVQVIQKRASVPVDGARKFLRLKIAE